MCEVICTGGGGFRFRKQRRAAALPAQIFFMNRLFISLTFLNYRTPCYFGCTSSTHLWWQLHSMSNSVFDALDRLNNGARRPSQYKYEQLYEDGKAPRQQHYYDPNDYMDAQYAQDAYDCDYSQANGYAAEPMQTDSFGMLKIPGIHDTG